LFVFFLYFVPPVEEVVLEAAGVEGVEQVGLAGYLGEVDFFHVFPSREDYFR
jgi:hypothetical protein